MAIKDIDSMSFEELKKEFIQFRTTMMNKIQEQENTIAQYKQEKQDLQANLNDVELQLKIQKEINKQLIAAKYQSQRNQVVCDMPTLFIDIEEEALKVEEEQLEEVIAVGAYKRIRKPKEKHINYDNLETEEVILPIPAGQDLCEICGSKMKIKKYDTKEELVYIPYKIIKRITKIPVLECEECQSINEDGKSNYYRIKHNFLFPRSLCSPELLSYIIDMKYNNGLPIYAIEKMFERSGVAIPRQNMVNWILSSTKYLEPLYNLMKKDLIQRSYLQADETPTQVLNEEGKQSTSTSYMWVYRTIKYDTPIVMYEYADTRAGRIPQEFLEGYQGYLVSDAYDGYNRVSGITRCLCNVHTLRKFKDAYKLLENTKERKQSNEAKAIQKYDEIFHTDHLIEEKAKEKHSDFEKRMAYITKRRQEEIKPKFDEFLSWLEGIQSKMTGRYSMSKAINYVLNYREELMEFINDARIPMDNSSCERSIRPFVVIRNRCKFSVSPKGAHIGAIIYSLVITCIENKQNPYMYLAHLFEELPNIDLNNETELRKYLPYSQELPDYTRILSRIEIKAILDKHSK